eukprot:1655057-Pyramimonas_sp.AAC.1
MVPALHFIRSTLHHGPGALPQGGSAPRAVEVGARPGCLCVSPDACIIHCIITHDHGRHCPEVHSLAVHCLAHSGTQPISARVRNKTGAGEVAEANGVFVLPI